MSAERFLDLYREIEELLEKRYARESSPGGNVILRFLQEKQGSRYREELNLCREIRNVLSHHSTIQGRPVVVPAPELLQVMERLIAELQEPPLALDYATPAEKIILTTPQQRVLRLMATMREKGYSHIPVRVKGKIQGVFSISSVFSYMLKYPAKPLSAETRVEEFSEFLPLDSHGERFLFAGPRLNYWEAREAFSQVRKNRRLAVIFLTSDGTKKGRLLGMLTPWDVLGREEEISADQEEQ